MDEACKTPMRDHLERFWELLGEGRVRILIDSHHAEGFGGTGHWTSASFPDDVAKALLAERRAAWQPIETAPKDGSYIWVSQGFSMRIAFWANGKEFEYQGSVGGGWRDLALAERGGAADLMFSPTYWLALPKSPDRLAEAKLKKIAEHPDTPELIRQYAAGTLDGPR